MSANKTWITNPYNGQNFVDPDSGLRYAKAYNPANPDEITNEPEENMCTEVCKHGFELSCPEGCN